MKPLKTIEYLPNLIMQRRNLPLILPVTNHTTQIEPKSPTSSSHVILQEINNNNMKKVTLETINDKFKEDTNDSLTCTESSEFTQGHLSSSSLTRKLDRKKKRPTKRTTRQTRTREESSLPPAAFSLNRLNPRPSRPEYSFSGERPFHVNLNNRHLSVNTENELRNNLSPNTFQAERLCLRISEILPGELYLGSEENLRDIEDIKASGITTIISVIKEKPPLTPALEQLGITARDHHHFPLRDRGDENIARHFEEINRIITNSRGATFIHCHRGISRSASFCTSYIMATKQLKIEAPSKPTSVVQAALDVVKQKRHIAEPNLGFFGQLTEYAKQIRCLDYPIRHGGRKDGKNSDDPQLSHSDMDMDTESHLEAPYAGRSRSPGKAEQDIMEIS